MGAYLSEPVTAKHSTEDSSDTLVVGASSMQGWRVNQEDAHNTILDFDKGVQMFAVYDGHGGAEVAQYCSQKLPDFIRKAEAYIKGDLEEALKQAFLNIDASLTESEVIAELRKIAFSNESDAEDDEENVANLCEEAQMPIEAVIAKYQSDASNPAVRKLQSSEGKTPLSPYIRRGGASGSGAGSSGSGDAESAESGPSSSGVSAGSSGTSSSSAAPSSEEEKPSETVKDSSSSDVKEDTKEEVKDKMKEETTETKTTEAESIESKTNSNGPSAEGSGNKTQINGDIAHSEKEEPSEATEGVSSSTEASALKNGDLKESEEVKPKGKGKAKEKTRSISKDEEEESESKAKGTPNRTRHALRKSNLQIMKFLAGQVDYSDSDESEDENDTTFEEKADSNSDDDDEEREDGDDDDDDEEEEDEDDSDETDSEDEEMDDDMMKAGDYNEEPGSGSGCTAVVALLRGRDLFVANAGDSRCVVSRGGKAIDLSLDHKPEDEPEMKRILAAGGKVTADGRVNGGLNLSRAIGDHGYKLSKDLPATDQMITALPDVRTLRIDPAQDEFMVLACDGIWNYMSSQQVVDFVRTRLVDEKLKPSQICEQLFDHCLSPNTVGDGTGCDNMTAVIVQFKAELASQPSTLERETILESPFCNEATKKNELEDLCLDKEEDEEAQGDADETEEEEEEKADDVSGPKKRVVDCNDSDESNSPKSKKIKVDSEANEANGVQV